MNSERTFPARLETGSSEARMALHPMLLPRPIHADDSADWPSPDRGSFPMGNTTGFPLNEEKMVELFLLLPSRQVAALEQLAHSHGLTIGQLLRRLIEERCSNSTSPPVG